jgi:hypothetical protein
MCRAQSVPRQITINLVSGPFLEYDPLRIAILFSPVPAVNYTVTPDRVAVFGQGFNMLTQGQPRRVSFPFDGDFTMRQLNCIGSGTGGTVIEVMTLIAREDPYEWLYNSTNQIMSGSRMPSAPSQKPGPILSGAKLPG